MISHPHGELTHPIRILARWLVLPIGQVVRSGFLKGMDKVNHSCLLEMSQIPGSPPPGAVGQQYEWTTISMT